jgi:hypothetical protein
MHKEEAGAGPYLAASDDGAGEPHRTLRVPGIVGL